MLYAGATMFLSQLFFFTYVKYAWGIDSKRFAQILAVAQGIDLSRTEEKLRKEVSGKIAEIHYTDVLGKRAERAREQEFFGSNMKITADDISGQERLAESKLKTLNARIIAFEQRLSDVEKKAQDDGVKEETLLFDGLRPEAAKNALMSIVNDENDIDRAILIVKGMDLTKRSKMMGTMETEDERKTLVQILQLIGDGAPITPVVKDTQSVMNADKKTE